MTVLSCDRNITANDIDGKFVVLVLLIEKTESMTQ